MTPQRNTGAGAEAELPEYAGHYRLESCLGSGGMGVVHLARSTSGLKLAVKIVHAEFAKDPEFRGRFRQEVAAARRVSGAFTAPVVDADPEAERPWMATLFIPGPTLSEQVKQHGPMAPAQLRRLMAGLAEALRDIHRVGVVHRDLKPSNVLLADDGPKVIDFGISRPKDSELRTETGKLIGTPPFMAPEQFRRPREVGPAADIFALGSVLVHAATGRGPFDSDSPYVVAYQVVHDEPDLTGVPEDLAPLLLRCLAKEPEDRPTPDELMRELRAVAASYDTQAFVPDQRASGPLRPEPEPVVGRAAQRGLLRRLRTRTVLVSAALGLLVAGAFGSVQLLGDDSPTASGTAPRTTPAGFEAWQEKPVSAQPGVPQCSFGTGRLFCARSGVVFALDPADGAVLWRRPITGAGRLTPVLSGGLVHVATSDGRRLAALDPSSGRTRGERDMPAQGGRVFAGGMLLLARADRTVTGVESASGSTRWSRRIAGYSLPSLASFPGNPSAYATSTSDDGTRTQITAVDPGTGAVRWEARLRGYLTPVGAQGGSVFLLDLDRVTGDAKAVVRYTTASRKTRRVALPVRLQGAQAGVRGGVVNLMASGGALEAVDMDAGKQLWHLESAVSRGSAPVSDGRHVYVVAADGRLLAVDARTGRLVGQTPPRLGTHADKVVGDLAPPVLAAGHVYAGAPDGTVFAVDGRDPASW
ncbi:serine/threonine-protein kinase [Streptomyces sp. NRRL S-813]|uniref:serine/threonine-protein kinase n=1 Tax=Streptomyces sp. NRRL S-813 TaxID=1463919 RepID=UPI0004C0DF42|nr:serine/threonine-protein kinase [Streptomyces sp. NRRL S-813]